MPGDHCDAVQLHEECGMSRGGRSSSAGRTIDRRRNPKRTSRLQPSIDPVTPPPKRPLVNPKGAPVKEGPPEGSLAADSEASIAEVHRQLRECWRKADVLIAECCDDFAEASIAARHEAIDEDVRAVTGALEKVRIEEVLKETTEVDIETESDPEGASLRQHHNEIGRGTDDRKGL